MREKDGRERGGRVRVESARHQRAWDRGARMLLDRWTDQPIAAEPGNADVEASRVQDADRRHRTRGDEGREEQRETQAPAHAGKYDTRG